VLATGPHIGDGGRRLAGLVGTRHAPTPLSRSLLHGTFSLNRPGLIPVGQAQIFEFKWFSDILN
jgi:hypothetical protein